MTRLGINAEIRTEAGKGPARRLRQQGKVPGIVYGTGVDELKVQVDANPLQKLLTTAGAGGLIDLNIDGETKVVLIRDIQREPNQGQLLHVDFHAVNLSQEVQTQVPLVIVGEESRPTDGGIIAPGLREVVVTCLPTAIPERIDVDVSGLGLGESLTVGDLQAPEGVVINTIPEEVVVSVMAPRTSQAAAGDGAAEAQAEEQQASEGGQEAAE